MPPLDDTPYLDSPVSWYIGNVDFEHPKKWEDEASFGVLKNLCQHLKSIEGRSWRELSELPHNHDWEDTSEWEKPSQDRVAHLNLNDQSAWYQIHTTRLGRLFGFRVGTIMNLVWWDRDHEVYKTKGGRK